MLLGDAASDFVLTMREHGLNWIVVSIETLQSDGGYVLVAADSFDRARGLLDVAEANQARADQRE